MNFVIHWNETAMGLHVFPIPIPPPTSLSTRSLWVFPVHQVRALVSYIQPGLVICFTLDNIHVLMLFSWNIPPSLSPTESKRLFYKSVSLRRFTVLNLFTVKGLQQDIQRHPHTLRNRKSWGPRILISIAFNSWLL